MRVKWLIGGRVIPGIGRMVEGEERNLPKAVALDCIAKKWAKEVKPKKIKPVIETETTPRGDLT